MDSLYAFDCKRFRNIRNIVVELFSKHPALPVEVTLNRNYPRKKLCEFCYITTVRNTVHVL
jgi:hypothetical protein